MPLQFSYLCVSNFRLLSRLRLAEANEENARLRDIIRQQDEQIRRLKREKQQVQQQHNQQLQIVNQQVQTQMQQTLQVNAEIETFKEKVQTQMKRTKRKVAILNKKVKRLEEVSFY